MWFKNLIIYRLEDNFELDVDNLEEKLGEHAFQHCASQQPWNMGWVPPMGRNGIELHHTAQGFTLLKARREERLLPAGVVKEAVDEKVEAIEIEQDRRVGRKERLEIREELTFDMMPKAFTRSSYVSGLIMPAERLLVVDSSNRNRAEEWLTLLRQSLGSLPVRPLETAESPIAHFTGWLSGQQALPNGLVVGDQCELRSTEESGAVLRVSRQDLGGDELHVHFDAGKVAVKLALEWNENLSFVLNDAMEIKRLRFSDSLMEEAQMSGDGDAAAEFDASFVLMSMELNRFLPALFNLFGGIMDSEKTSS